VGLDPESVRSRRPSYTFASGDLPTVEPEIARVGIGPMLHGSVRHVLLPKILWHLHYRVYEKVRGDVRWQCHFQRRWNRGRCPDSMETH